MGKSLVSCFFLRHSVLINESKCVDPVYPLHIPTNNFPMGPVGAINIATCY